MWHYDPDRITYLGFSDYRNKREKFGIKAKDRAQHVYVIGKTGMGKSTLLDNMAVQDIQNGEGVAFLDPHGNSAESLLDYVPEERIEDVLYFSPSDGNHPISFNVLEDIGYDKRHLVVSGLMSAFEKIWADQWSARMAYILQNTILALLEYPDATLLAVNRMYIDKNFRKDVISHVTDPAVKNFWEGEFANYTDRFAQEATPAIQNKIGQFVSNPVIRNIISQPKSTFDVRELMDNRKILIVNLSKGQIGESNANLLGSLLVTKIYLAALSRADVTPEELAKLPQFNLFVDEFQSFANKSFADILSEARKYKLSLHIAHQYVEQMPEEVSAAVFGNVGTMITFRVGGTDAEAFEKEFAPQFTAEDFVNLDRFQMYLKLMIDNVSSKPFSAASMPPIDMPKVSYKDMIVARSREKYAQPREVVEQALIEWHEEEKNINRPQQGGGPRKGGGPPKKRFDVAAKPPAASREEELRRAMSLDHLRAKQPKAKKKKKPKKKAPAPESVEALRSALTDVMGIDPTEIKKQKEKAAQENKKQDKSPQQQPKQNQQSNRNRKKVKKKEQQPVQNAGTNEVPEHVLKKMLEMEKGSQ